MSIGFLPLRTSLTILVFRPMAAIAIIMKNLLKSLNGVKNSDGTPALTAMVVITEAATKNKMKKGKIFLKETFSEEFPSFFARRKARKRVIGIMARVRVSLTVTALSKVACPRLWMESHVEAAAVTEDVSLTAVPAKIPKASPLVEENPTSAPNSGKRRAARMLKKKITEMA